MSHTQTFLFHDYETWGVNPKTDFPCQFAAIRTDANFSPVGEPINIMSQIPNDYLPNPNACLVTGITPQQSLQNGLLETDFAQKIFNEMSVPNTCSLGYNSMRFDDEVTRFLFYRNFLDPYTREWQHGNSRWDIIDLARACYALRPEGIHWPVNDEGLPSFKLEHLTAANNIEHSGAHDALADVTATIALAQLLKKAQPKLFDYALSLRDKQRVWSLVNVTKLTPLIHVSAKIPAAQGCCSWVLPIAQHPSQKNSVICVDLSKDVTDLLDKPADELKTKLYCKASDLAPHEQRPGLKLIHVNKSPFVTSAKALSASRAEQIGLDRTQCLANYQKLIQAPQCLKKLISVFEGNEHETPELPEQRLYSEGFISNADKQICLTIRQSKPEQLASYMGILGSENLRKLLFHYRGRNFPATLNHQELVNWQRHREQRLTEGVACNSMSVFYAELDRLVQLHAAHPKYTAILKSLYRYAQNL